MDDHTLFGSVVYRLTFSDAIAQGLLCRYQVAVIPISDDEVHGLIQDRRFVTADGDRTLLAGSLATQIACARAMRRFGCRRLVAFQPSIPQSQRFADHFPVAAALLPDDERPDGELWCHHVDGSKMPFPKRARLIEQFRATGRPNEYRLLSNVRLLAEGVDVPGIDAIAFVDTRRGHAQIVQAVGRAVRTAPGKTVGTIVLPIVLRTDEAIEAALARTEHRMVVDVLGALRSHDPGVVKSLDTLRFGASSEPEPTTTNGRFVIDAPVEVGEEFAEAVGVALATALGVPAHSGPSRRRARQAVVVEERRQPSPEEMFAIGCDELRKLAMWSLLPRVPSSTNSYPLAAWWEEAMRRWADGRLEPSDKVTIADAVSWLAPGLAGTSQQAEMIAITNYSVPEQVAAQLRAGGMYASSELSCLVEDGGDPDHLVEPFEAIHDAITHPGISPAVRSMYLVIALRRLASAVVQANATPPPDYWHWTTQRKIAIDAFVYGLGVARAGTSPFDRPPPPHNRDLCPEAHELGFRAAELLRGLVDRMRAYRFPGDVAEVERRRFEEAELEPDERFDALAWDIYMLVRANDGSPALAAAQALDGPLRQRRAVRKDRLRSAIRRIERDDAVFG
jgi:hypothetical protein